MITGLGTDIVNIARVEKTLEKFGVRFCNRVFTAAERAELDAYHSDSRAKAAKAAKIFAAKEAASKALGTGFNQGISWQDIELGHDELGKPMLHFTGKAAARLASTTAGTVQILVSLSDDYPFAQAVVIIEKL